MANEHEHRYPLRKCHAPKCDEQWYGTGDYCHTHQGGRYRLRVKMRELGRAKGLEYLLARAVYHLNALHLITILRTEANQETRHRATQHAYTGSNKRYRKPERAGKQHKRVKRPRPQAGIRGPTEQRAQAASAS